MRGFRALGQPYPTAPNLFFPVIWTYNKEDSGSNKCNWNLH